MEPDRADWRGERHIHPQYIVGDDEPVLTEFIIFDDAVLSRLDLSPPRPCGHDGAKIVNGLRPIL